jgi:ABC-type nickel/cobalt efflux system permease component RcnA
MKDLTEALPPRDSYKPPVSNHWLEIGLVLGAALLIAVFGMIWARYLRQSRRRRHTRSQTIMGAGQGEHSIRRHRHHERYTHRNPTLAETGGLPPVRDDVSSPPGPQPS